MMQNAKVQKVYEGRKVVSVILDIATYEEMIEMLEQIQDIRALEELRKEPIETMSAEEYLERRAARV